MVIVVGASRDKMEIALEVIKSHGFAATGVFSEAEAQQAITAHQTLFAVVTGGAIEEPARDRLRAAAATKGAVLIAASIGHDDPKTYFTENVIPKLLKERDRY
jgi:hypothetical protein